MIEFIIIGMVVFLVLLMFSWYKVVPPSQAHLVVTPRSRFVASADKRISAKTTYFAIPSSIPFLGRRVRIMDLTIKEITKEMEAYEKDQGRYHVRYSLNYRVNDVEVAAETFVIDADLDRQLEEIIQAAVRAVTVNYSVTDTRGKKKEMTEKIDVELNEDLAKWGLELINFVLVDFQDTPTSKIISNISSRRETEIETETRQLNAEKHKNARTKEAEADELSRLREIQRDEGVAKREQEKAANVAGLQKATREKELEVTKVNAVKNAEIIKEQRVIEAQQEREVEEITKEQKRLQGEGDRLRSEEQAKGDAAKIRENGFAEAEAKERLQEALNKFDDKAIRALVAEKIVQAQKEIGVAAATALGRADLRIFAGGNGDASGFDLGRIISGLAVSNDGAAAAMMNRIARPNDLGLASMNLSTAPVVDKKNVKVEK